jgi:ABC-type glycerol-3-phosphate transport system permease component
MKEKRISVLGFVVTGLTVITAVAWLFPVYWIIATAFKSETDTVALPPSFVPLPPDFEAFTYVIQNSPVFRWYLNTIVVSAVITVVSISCALMCAYALSRIEFRGKFLINLALLVGFIASLWGDGDPVVHADEQTASRKFLRWNHSAPDRDAAIGHRFQAVF